jgi:hypothetical protein
VLLFLIAALPLGFALNLEYPTEDVRGVDFASTANISHDVDLSYTVIDAEVENHGYENVLVVMPEGWEPDYEIYSAKGEPIIRGRIEFYDKYGRPWKRNSFVSNNYVFWQEKTDTFTISRGLPLVLEGSDEDGWSIMPSSIGNETGSERIGWYVRPNERLMFRIKMFPGKEDEEAIIDPTALERNRADIKVTKWDQEFIIYPDLDTPTGFLRAPYLVKGATMVEATPGVISNLSAFYGGLYWDLFKIQNLTPASTPTLGTEPEPDVIELDPPSWDEWFSSTGLFSLTPTSLASLKTEIPVIPEVNKTEVIEEEEPEEEGEEGLFDPVWFIDLEFYQTLGVGTTQGRAIRYVYEWRPGKVINGVETHKFKDPYVTKTDKYGDTLVSASQLSSEIPSTTPKPEPELDLTSVPPWYNWFN